MQSEGSSVIRRTLAQVGIRVAPAASGQVEGIKFREVFFVYYFGNGSQRREIIARQVQLLQSPITFVYLASQLNEVVGQFLHTIGEYSQRFQVFQFTDFLAQRNDTCLVVGITLDFEGFQVLEITYFFRQYFAFLQVEQGEFNGTYTSHRSFGYILVGSFP